MIGAPVLATAKGRELLRRIEAALAIPACLSEGPRGFNDASLGAYADVAKRADMVLLLGKALDFTLKFGGAPFPADCRFIAIDPDGAMLDRAARSRGLAFGCVADTYPAARSADSRRRHLRRCRRGWRMPGPASTTGPRNGRIWRRKPRDMLHPAQVFRALQPFLDRDPDSVLICDGGEFAQWGQSILRNDRRMINGVAGSIGSSLPMAAGARVVERKAPVFAVLGDGTFGFHMSEIETAVRLDLPYVAIVGTDCRWNAEI